MRQKRLAVWLAPLTPQVIASHAPLAASIRCHPAEGMLPVGASSAAQYCVSADGKEILSETAMRSLLKRVDLQHLEDRAGGFFQVLPSC